mmetsp:Transcript_78860/g.219269  ORF Transcript_78860/g.219269 Transcript_78860/m.219269 type:complete len:309 (-) Transcript_78860:168-1094(-)
MAERGAPFARDALGGGCCGAWNSQASGLVGLPRELLSFVVLRHMDRAAPVAQLACSARHFATELRDEKGRLRVGAMSIVHLQTVAEGLDKASLEELEVLRIDLSKESRAMLRLSDVESAVQSLGDRLGGATSLRVFMVRLAAFDDTMERLRLSRKTWEALIRGIASLAHYKQLQTLELSSIAIKASHATHAISFHEADTQRASGAASTGTRQLRRAASSPASPTPTRTLTFLEALEGLSGLEELFLTYDEIFSNTAELLPPVFNKLERLRTVDLTRNHISKQAMQAVRAATPAKVELRGAGQQTFFFY